MADNIDINVTPIIREVTIEVSQAVQGDSAYQVWLNNGNIGTEAEYLASLVGASYDDTAIQAEVDLNTLKETNIAHPVVEKAVPSDALFTDTVYDDTAIQASVLANTTAIGDIDTAIDIINGQII